MTEKTDWQNLIEKYTKNVCTKEEFAQLLELIGKDQDNEGLTEELRKHWEKAGYDNGASVSLEEKAALILLEAKEGSPVIPLYAGKRKILLRRLASVAAILLLFMGGYFSFYSRNNSLARISKTSDKYAKRSDVISPGGNKAVLTLSDGSFITLDSAKNGMLTRQGNIKIIKSEDGELLYYVDQPNSATLVYNTISTPRGGKYKVVLSDGSEVWLNAASSLKFPASFRGKARNVILTGEGYFEVAKNKSMPFFVTAGDITVEVLGTHFNVNSYADENAVATTLLEGSVKVKMEGMANSDSHPVILETGEQANFNKEGILKVDHSANLEQVVAWKNNNFEFNNTDIPAIMRQVSRWYDVGVDYKGAKPLRRFTGKISRNVNISQLIDMLEYTGVNMKMENKKIVIW